MSSRIFSKGVLGQAELTETRHFFSKGINTPL